MSESHDLQLSTAANRPVGSAGLRRVVKKNDFRICILELSETCLSPFTFTTQGAQNGRVGCWPSTNVLLCKFAVQAFEWPRTPFASALHDPDDY